MNDFNQLPKIKKNNKTNQPTIEWEFNKNNCNICNTRRSIELINNERKMERRFLLGAILKSSLLGVFIGISLGFYIYYF